MGTSSLVPDISQCFYTGLIEYLYPYPYLQKHNHIFNMFIIISVLVKIMSLYVSLDYLFINIIKDLKSFYCLESGKWKTEDF